MQGFKNSKIQGFRDSRLPQHPEGNFTDSYEILLFDRQGNMLRRTKINENPVQYDCSTLPNGIYFLHIYTGDSATSETHKVIVKH
ncbi:MAG: T9SS type A sorting domain-containing protein [Tannerella sp.]|nr:T9SS type A sorting domain-containing protein [Tannerella sp.]